MCPPPVPITMNPTHKNVVFQSFDYLIVFPQKNNVNLYNKWKNTFQNQLPLEVVSRSQLKFWYKKTPSPQLQT